MTVMVERAEAMAPTVMPVDPTVRYQTLTAFTGLWVILASGDFVLDGQLVEVFRPNLSAECPAPTVTIDTGRARVRGAVLAGDLLAA